MCGAGSMPGENVPVCVRGNVRAGLSQVVFVVQWTQKRVDALWPQRRLTTVEEEKVRIVLSDIKHGAMQLASVTRRKAAHLCARSEQELCISRSQLPDCSAVQALLTIHNLRRNNDPIASRCRPLSSTPWAPLGQRRRNEGRGHRLLSWRRQ